MKFVRQFSEIGIGDLASVGGKNASLGEMVRELSGKGIQVPGGFAVTADGYRHLLAEAQLEEVLRERLAGLDPHDVADLQKRGAEIRRAMLAAPLPADLAEEIRLAYRQLSGGEATLDVAVRSSATAEDLPEASFAGQQETYLNVQGEAALLEAVRRSFASLFTDRAISYRQERGFDHLTVALSVGIQRMVRSDLGSSGVMFTIDTETGFRDVVLINAAWGLGENVVQGAVNPDEFLVFKPTLKQGFKPILRRRTGTKEFKLIYDTGGGRMTRNVPVPPEDRGRLCVSDEDVLKLAGWACVIEDHYSQKRGEPTPMDIEWARDGRSGELFILQARPETVVRHRAADVLERYRLRDKGNVLVRGRSVGEKIASGPVRIVHSVRDLGDFREGEVLVAEKTDPDWEPTMKKAAAIVTDRGGRTCHAAIVSRELGLAAVVGAEGATGALQPGQVVTISCAEGDTGNVYEGSLAFDVERTDLSRLPRPRTKIMMNVGNPEEALKHSFIPNDGVGLAREEFIITGSIGIHPMALIRYEALEDAEARDRIAKLTAGYDDKPQFFVDRLAEGAAVIAAAFYPKPVILRFSDFKTNEYANLIGGGAFEPREENPMLGFRGASRYYHERFREAFALECRAVLKVRRDMGLTNLMVMVPFCRTVEEGRRVIREMAGNGLECGMDGLEVYVMCEIPSNVLLAREFAEVFDGFSIGSNDLTQLVLGVDRDSAIVAPLFDERNPAVKLMIAGVIETAREAGRKIGICGQAPSDYPEFAAFLVEAGIDSISLNPDAVLKTTMTVLQAESGQSQPPAPRNPDAAARS